MSDSLPKPMIEIDSVAKLIETYVNEAFDKKYQEIISSLKQKFKKISYAFLVSGWSGAIAIIARSL